MYQAETSWAGPVAGVEGSSGGGQRGVQHSVGSLRECRTARPGSDPPVHGWLVVMYIQSYTYIQLHTYVFFFLMKRSPIYFWFNVGLFSDDCCSNLEARKLLDQMVAAGGVTDVITYNTLAKVGVAKCCDSDTSDVHRTARMCIW